MHDLVFWQAFEARDARHTDAVIGTAGAGQRRTSDGEVATVGALSPHTPLSGMRTCATAAAGGCRLWRWSSGIVPARAWKGNVAGTLGKEAERRCKAWTEQIGAGRELTLNMTC